MKKTLVFLPVIFLLSGCNVIDFKTTPALNPEILWSGGEKVSEMRTTAKESWKAYYEDTIKDSVDIAVTAVKEQAETVKEEAKKAVQEAKNQYNSGVETINQNIQGQADEAKEQINKLKI